jgi:hypothetical protein
MAERQPENHLVRRGRALGAEIIVERAIFTVLQKQ